MPARSTAMLLAAAGLLAAAPAAVFAQDDGGGAGADTSVSEVVVTAPGNLPPGSVVRSRAVSYADLDLSVPEGARTLLGRIRAAAGQVCQPEPDRSLNDQSDHRTCVDDAIESAVADLDAPEVTRALEDSGG